MSVSHSSITDDVWARIRTTLPPLGYTDLLCPSGIFRKGRTQEDEPLIDEQLSLRQAESILQFVAESDDHETALALSRGEDLPPPTVYQRALEDSCALATLSNTLCDAKSNQSSEASSIAGPSNQTAPTAGSFTTSNRVQCIVCVDRINSTQSFRAPCSHYYCQSCILAFAEASTRDDSLFPLQCCQEILSPNKIARFLPAKLKATFLSKSIEHSSTYASRVYCCAPACSAYLGAFGGSGRDLPCPECKTLVCSNCRQAAHPGDSCADNASTLEVKALATARGWQSCPDCHAIIERVNGCLHMTCRCSASFCYRCGTRWKNCSCPS
ncbi:hypothetical protein BV22DRAFT_871578 [Leucogyrophana mollusca]|uniref:Uncharacterized protein n=1 Tax=Leucogyrophana mollusca TaxID=85980 RepID=A0ACB8B279_9AGAM|nr:hypothetical protein BV22DRAFT_871578 [Leucogyrophana mollusca]